MNIHVQQEDAISEARQVESEAATYLDQISRYYLTRGKMIAKAAKYPHVVSLEMLIFSTNMFNLI